MGEKNVFGRATSGIERKPFLMLALPIQLTVEKRQKSTKTDRKPTESGGETTGN
jgi:hypothetical protein